LRKAFYKATISIISIIIFMVNTTGCAKKEKLKSSEEKQKINLYIDLKDKESLEIIRSVLDEFNKENNDKELIINNLAVDNKLEEDLIQGKLDMIIVCRKKMLTLSQKGLLSDMAPVHSNIKINEKYYNITSSYGRIGDKYFGIGLMPSSIEILYNTEALKKLNLEPPKNIKEAMEIVKKLNAAETKIPVKLPEEIDIKLLPAAFIFTNVANMEKVQEAYGASKEGYLKLQLQPVFDALNTLIKDGYANADTFEVATDSTVERLINGDIPIMVADSTVSKKLKDSKVEVVKEFTMDDKKIKNPVICSGLVCIPANSKNEETVNDIIKFIFDDKTQEKLADMGYITTNKEVNKKKWTESPNKDIALHLEEADADSIFFLHNFPEEFEPNLESAVINILEGKYTGKEWEEIVNKSTK